MALIYTPSPDLGKPCPDFSLLAVDGKTYTRRDFEGAKAVVIMFICNHCPYVKAIETRLLELAREMAPKGVKFAGVCSNDAARYPDDSFENIKKTWSEKKYSFPYLYDESQSVAREFGAVCTPDFFVYDSSLKLAYRGRLDDSWKDPATVTKRELKNALEQLIKNEPVEKNQAPSMGCSIKWKD